MDLWRSELPAFLQAALPNSAQATLFPCLDPALGPYAAKYARVCYLVTRNLEVWGLGKGLRLDGRRS